MHYSAICPQPILCDGIFYQKPENIIEAMLQLS
jgi:hypothetical protein